MTDISIYEILRDSLVAGAALAAAITAHNGLETWKSQMKGTVEYELTRRLLRAIYKYRDAFSVVRHPAMWGGEFSAVPDGFSGSQELAEHLGIVGAYEKRWQHVLDSRSDIDRELLEAEILWDSSVKERVRPLFELQGELFATLHAYLQSRDPRRSERERNSYADIYAKRLDVLYETGHIDDKFSRDVCAAILSIEEWLKPRLRK